MGSFRPVPEYPPPGARRSGKGAGKALTALTLRNDQLEAQVRAETAAISGQQPFRDSSHFGTAAISGQQLSVAAR